MLLLCACVFSLVVWVRYVKVFREFPLDIALWVALDQARRKVLSE